MPLAVSPCMKKRDRSKSASRSKPNSTPRSAGKSGKKGASKGASRSTVSGPSHPDANGDAKDRLEQRMEATQALAASMPYNRAKASEHGDAAQAIPGETVEPITPDATGSTITETQTSPKVGAGTPVLGANRSDGSLDRVRVDSGDRPL